MTVDQVKEELPKITVRMNGKTYEGIVTGRKNQYATVYVKAEHGGFPACEVSWEAVTHLVNTGRPLNY